MIAITVDDEHLMLRALTKAVSASPDIEEAIPFQSCSAALEWLGSNFADIAFLDISMRGMGGLALAEKIAALHPACKIVFCTGYEKYALEAIQLRCSGYLMKPISAEAVQKEIDHIKQKSSVEKQLTVKCFGTFEVLCQGRPLTFKRSKSKELLAVLIDRNGAGMSGKQICAMLWPEETDDAKYQDYFRHLLSDLRKALEEVGAGEVLQQESYQYRIRPELVQCDYYRYLRYGSPAFYGEYMTQYSWAEETCGLLSKR